MRCILWLKRKRGKSLEKSGLLWWVNMILHTFGWAIVVEVNDQREITNTYPGRVKFRGFSEEDNTAGYIKVSEYIMNSAEELLNESKE